MAPKPAARSKSPVARKDTGKEDAPADANGDAKPPKKPAAKKAPKKDSPTDGANAAPGPAPAKEAQEKPLGKKMRDGYWQGNLKLFKPNGKGIYIYNNGDKYEGTMVEGRRQTDAKGNNRKVLLIIYYWYF